MAAEENVAVAVANEWTQDDEDNFRYADTYHDFIGSRGFSVTGAFDKYGRTKIYDLMNKYVRKPPVTYESDNYYIGSDRGDPSQISKSTVEHDLVDFYELKYPKLFNRLPQDTAKRQKNSYIILLSNLAGDPTYFNKMHDTSYEIKEDVTEYNVDNVYTNIKEWLGIKELNAVMCDGIPHSFIKWMLDEKKLKYAYTWASQYDSAGVIGKAKKNDAETTIINSDPIDLTSVMQLTRKTDALVKVTGTAANVTEDFQIKITGGIMNENSYKATQNRGLSVNELSLLIHITSGMESSDNFAFNTISFMARINFS